MPAMRVVAPSSSCAPAIAFASRSSIVIACVLVARSASAQVPAVTAGSATPASDGMAARIAYSIDDAGAK
jgi:hypothetical protein